MDRLADYIEEPDLKYNPKFLVDEVIERLEEKDNKEDRLNKRWKERTDKMFEEITKLRKEIINLEQEKDKLAMVLTGGAFFYENMSDEEIIEVVRGAFRRND